MRNWNRREFIAAGAAALLARTPSLHASEVGRREVEVCIYGGTAAGIAAAVAARAEGCRVLVIEPSRWLGGMTGGGLMHIDWGRPEAVGGLARELLRDGITDPGYRRIFAELVRDQQIEVIYEHRLNAVEKSGPTLVALSLDHAPPDRRGCPSAQPRVSPALRIQARVFIDCTYEGDLLAQAGVSHAVGRESTTAYGESLAGVRPHMAVYPIDPYRKEGDPRSGLLPLLQDRVIGPEGSADRLVMGYGFRWRFTESADQLPIPLPDGFDPATFELFRRAFRDGVDLSGRRMREPGRYDREGIVVHSLGAGNLSRSLLAAANYGSNTDYPTGDWPTRARIWRYHQDFLAGLTHFLRAEPLAPANLGERARKVGFTPGMFDDTDGWPHQLYVREARRMVSDYVVTQRDLEGLPAVADSVGLASYGVDDWPYATIAHNGGVALQGGEFSMLYLDAVHRGIYPISYRAIRPKENECRNLLVPVCISASHIAMTSIRMEPVWMTLGEAAGVAAALAVRADSAVQSVDYRDLRSRLLARQLRLDRPSLP